jgi:hypothetical protein
MHIDLGMRTYETASLSCMGPRTSPRRLAILQVASTVCHRTAPILERRNTNGIRTNRWVASAMTMDLICGTKLMAGNQLVRVATMQVVLVVRRSTRVEPRTLTILLVVLVDLQCIFLAPPHHMVIGYWIAGLPVADWQLITGQGGANAAYSLV